jgi:hypothetical protein
VGVEPESVCVDALVGTGLELASGSFVGRAAAGMLEATSAGGTEAMDAGETGAGAVVGTAATGILTTCSDDWCSCWVAHWGGSFLCIAVGWVVVSSVGLDGQAVVRSMGGFSLACMECQKSKVDGFLRPILTLRVTTFSVTPKKSTHFDSYSGSSLPRPARSWVGKAPVMDERPVLACRSDGRESGCLFSLGASGSR